MALRFLTSEKPYKSKIFDDTILDALDFLIKWSLAAIWFGLTFPEKQNKNRQKNVFKTWYKDKIFKIYDPILK